MAGDVSLRRQAGDRHRRGSGIGAALCRALADEGAHVLCTDVDGDAAERTAAALGRRPGPRAST